eukprot:754231-Lingulodinium_polyedra.AAC.1
MTEAPHVAPAMADQEGPVFCTICGFWLNGLSQWDEHLRGRKHRCKTKGRPPPPPPPPDILETCRSVLW